VNTALSHTKRNTRTVQQATDYSCCLLERLVVLIICYLLAIVCVPVVLLHMLMVRVPVALQAGRLPCLQRGTAVNLHSKAAGAPVAARESGVSIELLNTSKYTSGWLQLCSRPDHAMPAQQLVHMIAW
jgi:hypothetical protein